MTILFISNDPKRRIRPRLAGSSRRASRKRGKTDFDLGKLPKQNSGPWTASSSVSGKAANRCCARWHGKDRRGLLAHWQGASRKQRQGRRQSTRLRDLQRMCRRIAALLTDTADRLRVKTSPRQERCRRGRPRQRFSPRQIMPTWSQIPRIHTSWCAYEAGARRAQTAPPGH